MEMSLAHFSHSLRGGKVTLQNRSKRSKEGKSLYRSTDLGEPDPLHTLARPMDTRVLNYSVAKFWLAADEMTPRWRKNASPPPLRRRHEGKEIHHDVPLDETYRWVHLGRKSLTPGRDLVTRTLQCTPHTYTSSVFCTSQPRPQAAT